MKTYDILQKTLYDSIILSLLKRNILSIDEAVNCLKDLDKKDNTEKDLNKDFIMVKHKGLTNPTQGNGGLEVVNNE